MLLSACFSRHSCFPTNRARTFLLVVSFCQKSKRPRQGRASVLQQKPFLAGGLSCNVWFNTPVLSKYVTWRWIYAACFISTIPSAYRIQFSYQVLLLRLLFGGVEINLRMTPADFSSDYHSAASCTCAFHGSILRQMCLRLSAAVRTIERKCCPHFFIHLSTTPPVKNIFLPHISTQYFLPLWYTGFKIYFDPMQSMNFNLAYFVSIQYNGGK